MPIKTVPFGTFVLLSLIPLLLLVPMINTNATVYWVTFVVCMIAFLALCTYCHRSVYRLRPQVKDLGSFYVFVTLGGVIGSGLVAVVLPVVLNTALELHFALIALIVYFTVRYSGRLPIAVAKIHIRSLQGLVLLVTIVYVLSLMMDTPKVWAVVSMPSVIMSLREIHFIYKISQIWWKDHVALKRTVHEGACR